MDPFAAVDVVRVGRGRVERDRDRAAAEEPLEVRLQDTPFAVIMRTPGADLELTAGFLLAEGVIRGSDEVAAIAHCRDAENVVNVTFVEAARDRVERALAGRRNVVANSSCGVCGRVTIDSLRAQWPPLAFDAKLDAGVIAAAADRLRGAQPVFDATGGLHAAAVFRFDGSVVTSAEDVGRHNAADKVIGRLLLREELPIVESMLFVSGRTSFEIVQKAWAAAIPVVASVSAPSSLAIAIAQEAGITLAGFVRDGAFNLYAHANRVVC
jgi:FdhD protein